MVIINTELTNPPPRRTRRSSERGEPRGERDSVTIDARGNIVEKRILQRIGHGIDEKVLAALEGWRFTPATQDGVPISSQHDIHFHFPN
ncbi:MAG: TonB family protein [Terriglobales bacterium]